MVKTALIIICIFVVPGTVAGLISSYRAGQKPHRPVFLVLQKFARKIFNQHTHRHVSTYWMHYLLITGLILVALGF